MTTKAKTNLVVVAVLVATAVGGWFHIPFWTIMLTLIGVAVVGFGGFIAITIRKSKRTALAYFDAHKDAVAAINGGDLDKACRVYESFTAVEHPDVALDARHRLTGVLIRRGELQAAIDKLLADQPPDPELGPLLDSDLALAHALLGNIDAARTWLRKADAEVAEKTRGYLAHTALVRAVIDCRSDRRTEAARELHLVWPACEAELTGQELRPLRVVRAFAFSNAGTRAGGSAETALAAVRPVYPGEHDYLGTAWPEMAQYLADNELSR